jgi:penicillin-binding protein 2
VTWFSDQQLARRVVAGRLVVWVVAVVLAVAFFRVQVLSSSRYRLRSEENRLRRVVEPAPRGLILDRNGAVLAENVPGYTISLLLSPAESLRSRLLQIAPIINLSERDLEQIERRYRSSPHQPVVLRKDAPFAMVSALEERRVVIPGLVVQAEPKRHYPYGPIAAHVVGYVGEITDEELRRAAIPGARMGSIVGREGLERSYDSRLRGRDGFRYIEVDALGRTVREGGVGSAEPPKQGETLRTTIDIELQRFVAENFPPEARGAVVVMHPVSGEILALYSSPSFDPNGFVGGFDPEPWLALSRSEASPLLNRAIQARYPPASPWKLVLAAVAMRRGIVDMDTRMTVPCRGGLQYYNRYFRCWRITGHGDLTLSQAIQHSCDVYFYQLGLRLGLTGLLQEAGQLGFREPSGIDLPGEATPIFPASTEYFNRRYGPRGWTNAVTLNLAIGQGENSQTLINMVTFYAMLANPAGVAPVPHLVQGRPASSGRSLGLSAEEIADLRAALLEVVERGTAAAAHIENLKIAGKTGTAQNPHGPDHGWFIAFAPVDDPQVVVGAIVEFARHGSSVAPMVNRIIARYLMGRTAPPLRAEEYRLLLPSDSAPQPVPILPDTQVASSGRAAPPDPR